MNNLCDDNQSSVTSQDLFVSSGLEFQAKIEFMISFGLKISFLRTCYHNIVWAYMAGEVLSCERKFLFCWYSWSFSILLTDLLFCLPGPRRCSWDEKFVRQLPTRFSRLRARNRASCLTGSWQHYGYVHKHLKWQYQYCIRILILLLPVIWCRKQKLFR